MTPTPSATLTLLWLLVKPPVLLPPAAPERALASASLALLMVDATLPAALAALGAAAAPSARAARIFISALALPMAVPTGCWAAAFVLAELDLMLVDLEAAAEGAADLAAAGVAELLREAASGFAGRPGVLWPLLILPLLRAPGLLLLLLLLGSFSSACRMKPVAKTAM